MRLSWISYERIKYLSHRYLDHQYVYPSLAGFYVICVANCVMRTKKLIFFTKWLTLHWRHNDHDGVSNHQPHGCLLNRIFRRRSKKTSKLRAAGLYAGHSPGPVNSPHKGPVKRKMFPFDDVIMKLIHQRQQPETIGSILQCLCRCLVTVLSFGYDWLVSLWT